jgi:hypothetical protein
MLSNHTQNSTQISPNIILKPANNQLTKQSNQTQIKLPKSVHHPHELSYQNSPKTLQPFSHASISQVCPASTQTKVSKISNPTLQVNMHGQRKKNFPTNSIFGPKENPSHFMILKC